MTELLEYIANPTETYATWMMLDFTGRRRHLLTSSIISNRHFLLDIIFIGILHLKLCIAI